MSWRTIVIESRCKLDYRMGYMVVRGAKLHRVLLDEIATLVIENSAVSITGCLLAALIERKIKVIFCDEKRNPAAELSPYYGSHDCVRKLRAQVAWSDGCKAAVWEMIIAAKIKMQASHLGVCGKQDEAGMLYRYTEEIEYFDSSNREEHAAKVYFNGLFGKDFTAYYDLLADGMSLELDYAPPSLNGILKCAGFSPAFTNRDLCEDLLTYMSWVRDLEKEKLFIFAGVGSYLSAE